MKVVFYEATVMFRDGDETVIIPKENKDAIAMQMSQMLSKYFKSDASIPADV
jgi:hypothetical protein